MLQEVYYSPNKIYKCNTRTTVAFVAFTTKNKQCETNGGGLSHWYNLSDL